MKRFAAGTVLFCALEAFGYIDPNFTPVDLVKQSDAILSLEVGVPSDGGTASAKVVESLKGKAEAATLTFELLAMPEALLQQGRAVVASIKEGRREALFFVGTFKRGEGEEERASAGAKGFLHFNGKWLVCARAKPAVWDLERRDDAMQATWAGGTDMLHRCVKYVLSDPDADVPVQAGRGWAPAVRFGKVAGDARAMAAVRVSGKTTDLFVASLEGDRVFRKTGETLEDVTSRHALTSASSLFAWGDFTGDERLDLASWSGKSLSLHVQAADGTFARRAVDLPIGLAQGCLSLSVIDARTLLVGTRRGPVCLTFAEDGSPRLRPAVEGEPPAADLGVPGACMAADFDGDAKPDVLHLYSAGSLFYRGLGDGRFDRPAPAKPRTGEGRHAVCLGDFDADGLPDLFVGGRDRHLLWQNRAGRFEELLHQSGEIEYIPKPGAVAVDSGDVNGDGLQDVLLVYGENLAPHVFFNRGFRSFGHARDMDVDLLGLLPDARGGCATGVLGDFTGDGALDMAVALKNGDLCLLAQRIEEGKALSVSASLSPGIAGPVAVSAWADTRPLGAVSLRADGASALWGVRVPGPVKLKWRLPGGGPQEREIIVEEGPVSVVLDKD